MVYKNMVGETVFLAKTPPDWGIYQGRRVRILHSDAANGYARCINDVGSGEPVQTEFYARRADIYI